VARQAAVTLAVVAGALASAAGPAHASTIVFVCGKDLCRTDEKAKLAVQLTHDGPTGAYSRPTISANGRRVAFKRGTPGRAYTAQLNRRTLSKVRRIGPAPDGARDATQLDVAIAPDGKRVAWVQQRIDVVFNTIDYRRYMAKADGSSPRQVASSGGRPFVAFYDATRILREGLTEAVDAMQEGESVDSGLCVPSPATATNGTCRGAGGALQVAFDGAGRHLRHPSMSPTRDRLVATAYASSENIDDTIEKPGRIALFDARTGQLVANLTSATADSGPVFSPDGKRVAFTRGSSVWTVPAAGGVAKRLMRRGTQPAWGR
jgi:Tol biopolymer transport system component